MKYLYRENAFVCREYDFMLKNNSVIKYFVKTKWQKNLPRTWNKIIGLENRKIKSQLFNDDICEVVCSILIMDSMPGAIASALSFPCVPSGIQDQEFPSKFSRSLGIFSLFFSPYSSSDRFKAWNQDKYRGQSEKI